MKVLTIVVLFALSLMYAPLVKAQCEYLEVSEHTLELINSGEKYGITDADSIQVVQKLSTYREFYKQWEKSEYTSLTINDAIPAWRWCLSNGPLASQYIYIDGIKIMKYLYENTEDEALKEAYIDTIFLIYDQRILAFGDQKQFGKGFILGQRAGDILKLRPKCYANAYENLVESVEIEGDNSYPHIIYYYYYTSTKMVEAKKADTTIIFDNYQTATAILSSKTKKYKEEGNTKQVDNCKNIQGKLDNLFGPWATCPDIVEIFGAKFEETPQDLDLLKSITNIMYMTKCTDEELYYKASDELYKLEPSIESAINLGKMYLKRAMYSKAITYLTIGVDSTEDAMDKADLYLLLGHAYRGASNFSTSRSMAYKCLELDPNRGEAYLLIGDLYYSSSVSCGGSGDDAEVRRTFGYMAAVDKYYKAANVTSNEKVKAAANQKAAGAASNYPETALLFFHGYSKGQSVTLGCWIQETITIKAID